jgi:hypothetical protein
MGVNEWTKAVATCAVVVIGCQALNSDPVAAAPKDQPPVPSPADAKNYPSRAAQRIAEAIGVPDAARRGRRLDAVAFGMGHGADATASTAKRHYIAPGARETGAAGNVHGVPDGGKATKRA